MCSRLAPRRLPFSYFLPGAYSPHPFKAVDPNPYLLSCKPQGLSGLPLLLLYYGGRVQGKETQDTFIGVL